MSYRDVIASDHPIDWWRYQAPSAGVQPNSIPNRPWQHARVGSGGANNVPFQASGGSFTGIAADGSSIALPTGNVLESSSALSLIPPYSVEAWVYKATDAGISGSTTAGVFQLLDNNAPRLQLETFGNGNAELFVTHGATTSNNTGSRASAVIGAWVHLVVVVDSVAGHTESYQNGIGDAFLTFIPDSILGGIQLQVGTFNSAPDILCLYTEIAIYGTALSLAQIQAHHSAADTLAPPKFRQPLGSTCA